MKDWEEKFKEKFFPIPSYDKYPNYIDVRDEECAELRDEMIKFIKENVEKQ